MVSRKSILRRVYPKRDPWSHKGEYGRLLVISGSKTFTGAPSIIGMAALRSGVDNVYFAGPKRAMDITASYYPTFMSMPLDCEYLDKACVNSVLDFASSMKISALAMGPGLWRNDKTKNVILKIIDSFDVPMVIDADAVRALGKKLDVLIGKNAVITPHSDEFREMTGIEMSTKVQERVEVVKECAKGLKITILLKGHVDVVSDGKSVSINKTGNVNMTKGGFGDMLTGVVGAFMARRKDKVSAYDAACVGAHINGMAGDLAAREKGPGLVVTDAIEKIPQIIKRR